MDIKDRIIKNLKKIVNEGEIILERPPNPEMGDYALPCFQFTKFMKMDPKKIAEDLKKKYPKDENIERVEVMGPYLNFFVNPKILANQVIGDIILKKSNFGKPDKKISEKVMIEFSQANTHKAFHVGHLRGTSIGEALSRLLKHNNYEVIKANYQGDTGMHVAKWLWAYFRKHESENPPKDDMQRWIANIYVEAVKEVSENEDYGAEVEEINRKLEDRSDKKIVDVWKKSRKWSLDSFENIYKDLQVSFDAYFFEGQLEEQAKKASQNLLKKGIAKEDEGAVIVNLEEFKLGVWVLLRKDGTTLYSSKDIALAERKFKEFNISRSVYVVGAAQQLHMKQLFKTLELMGFEQAKKCQHLSFAEVRFPTGQMSSRTGENILYTDLKKKVFEKSLEGVVSRHPDWNEKEKMESAQNLSVGAIKFGMLSQDPNKNIIFDIQKALDFEGETGPYIQYAHARICSILKKFGATIPKKSDLSVLNEIEEKKIILFLDEFKDVIESVSLNLRINLLANYALKLAQLFNEYYHKHKVITEDKDLTNARIQLVESVRQVLDLSLNLLGIPSPEKM